MKAIQGMHGKVTHLNITHTRLSLLQINIFKNSGLVCVQFLDGRVIFVEEAKPKSDLQRATKPRSDFNRSQTKPRTFRTW